jgi:hypothetical protein
MTKRRFSGTTGLFPQSLAGGGYSVAEAILRNRGFSHNGILDNWSAILGDEELAQHAFPIKLQKMQGHNQLIVKVHPAYKAIFAHQSDMFMARLNVMLGKNLVGRIKIV